ncbi:MAG: hypothetical protein K9N55_20165 [Phycisphaerae bacterium]|nr:hypothetical protein [Phycisphaerae bacterium]
MKSHIFLSLVLGLWVAGSLNGANNAFTGAVSDLWSNPDNWSEGRVPDETDAARVQNGAVCVLDYAAPAINQLNMRGGGSHLTLLDGAHLVSNSWSVISLNGGTPENRDVMEILGGVFDCYFHLRVADSGASLLVVDNGGTLNIHDVEFRVGYGTGGDGIVELRGGSLNLLEGTNALPLVFRNGQDSQAHMDFSGGVMTMAYSEERLAYINDHIADGTMTAYYDFPQTLEEYAYDPAKAEGTVVVESVDYDGDEAPDMLIVKGQHPLTPGPEDGANIVPGTVTLNWTLPDPCVPGQPVPVDVYFTDDYQALKSFVDPDAIRIAGQQNITSFTVQVQPKTRYFWAVDTYQGTDHDPVWGPIFQFYADNIAPEVLTVWDVTTWIDDGSVDVAIGGTVIDADATTVVWSVVSEPNEGAAVIAKANQIDTTVTLNAVGTYVLQLEANDGDKQGTDTLTISVYANSCLAAQSLPDYVPFAGDLDGDCDVDQDDLNLLMQDWLRCNALDACDPQNPEGL